MMKSEQINELAAALSKAQHEITGAKTDSTNPFFKSRYASLEAVAHALNEPFFKHGLSVSQTTTWEEVMGTAVVTTLMHSSGQWIQGVLPIMAIKQDPQGIGSALSYSRRYALAAIAGIYQTDDDGEIHRKASESVKQPVREKAFGETITTKAEPGSYEIKFGQYLGKTIGEVAGNLPRYISYLKDNAQKEGKPINTMALEMIKNYEAYTKSGANSHSSGLDGDLPF